MKMSGKLTLPTLKFTLFRSFFFVIIYGVFETYDNALNDLDKSIASHIYEFYKKQLQLMGYGHGTQIPILLPSRFMFVACVNQDLS